MRVIIAGSRDITDYDIVSKAVMASGWFDDMTYVISGAAQGVDTIGERFANEHHILVKRYPADWKGWGKRAGFIRNQEMALNADGLIAVCDGKSKGTLNMIEIMQALDLPVFIWRVKK